MTSEIGQKLVESIDVSNAWNPLALKLLALGLRQHQLN